MIPGAVIFFGKGLDWLFELPQLSHPYVNYVASGLLFVMGTMLIWFSTQHLYKAGGTPNPLRPAKKLVTTGVYALCRHPMFLGYDLCALAVALYLGSLGMILGSFPLFLLFEVSFLRKEEKILLLKFKNTYVEYRKNTPFLVPINVCRRT